MPFAGWDMPLHYGSQLQEHHGVRQTAGVFDVSHMVIVDISGDGARDFLRRLLANDVARLRTPGKALYSCMLTPQGGVVDDLIAYFLPPQGYRLVVNAGTAAKDLAWMEAQADGFPVQIRPRRDLAMLAIQGPQARDLALPLLPAELGELALGLDPFFGAQAGDWLAARTGYTGEDGLEIMLPADQAPSLWRGLLAAGVLPCGLGARDSLRLEAGMCLYGSDMDETTTPLESGLAWTLAWDPAERDFLGRGALQAQREQGSWRKLVGLILDGKGILRGHQVLWQGERQVGEITSGGYSPTLDRSIALALVDADPGTGWEVDIRGRRWPVRQVRPPFVRHGKVCIEP